VRSLWRILNRVGVFYPYCSFWYKAAGLVSVSWQSGAFFPQYRGQVYYLNVHFFPGFSHWRWGYSSDHYDHLILGDFGLGPFLLVAWFDDVDRDAQGNPVPEASPRFFGLEVSEGLRGVEVCHK